MGTQSASFEFSPEMSFWGKGGKRVEGGTASRIKLPSHQQQQRGVGVNVCVRLCVQSNPCANTQQERPPRSTLVQCLWSLTCGSVRLFEKHENWDPAAQRTSERKVRTNELNNPGEHG